MPAGDRDRLVDSQAHQRRHLRDLGQQGRRPPGEVAFVGGHQPGALAAHADLQRPRGRAPRPRRRRRRRGRPSPGRGSRRGGARRPPRCRLTLAGTRTRTGARAGNGSRRSGHRPDPNAHGQRRRPRRRSAHPRTAGKLRRLPGEGLPRRELVPGPSVIDAVRCVRAWSLPPAPHPQSPPEPPPSQRQYAQGDRRVRGPSVRRAAHRVRQGRRPPHPPGRQDPRRHLRPRRRARGTSRCPPASSPTPIRHGGANVLLTLDIEGGDQLALPKSIQRHPIKPISSTSTCSRCAAARRSPSTCRSRSTGEVAAGGAASRWRTRRSPSRPTPPTCRPSSRSTSTAWRRARTSPPPPSRCPSGATLVSDPETRRRQRPGGADRRGPRGRHRRVRRRPGRRRQCWRGRRGVPGRPPTRPPPPARPAPPSRWPTSGPSSSGWATPGRGTRRPGTTPGSSSSTCSPSGSAAGSRRSAGWPTSSRAGWPAGRSCWPSRGRT